MNFDLIQSRAERTPERPALWFNGRWLTYAQLNMRAIQMANRLRELGIKAGDRVSVLAVNHPVHIDLVLAAPKLGFIFAPLNHRLASEELRVIGRTLRPSFLFVDSRHQKMAREIDCPWARLSEYHDWLSVGSRAPLPPPPLTKNSTHMILLTGGSTGTPKGAMIPYRQTVANCVNTIAGWELSGEDCAIQATPCFHAALNVLTLPLLYAGGRVVLTPQFAPDDYLDLVAQHGVTLMFLVPTMFKLLSEAFDFDDATFSTVRWAISGGAPCPSRVRAEYARKGLRFRQGYGMTEAGVNCFMISADEAAEHPDSVGYPLTGTEAVVRRDDGTPCAAGEVGELTLSGPHVCSGYWEQPEAWQQVFADGWLWTGDLARVGVDGLHYIVGRSKDMYISGGENVYPLEVESVLNECSGVSECAVLPIPHETWGEVGLAVIAPFPGVQPNLELIAAELKARLASYKLPKQFFVMTHLPKTGAGKICKIQIRQQWEARSTA